MKRFFVVFLLVTPLWAQSYVPGELIIKFKQAPYLLSTQHFTQQLVGSDVIQSIRPLGQVMATMDSQSWGSFKQSLSDQTHQTYVITLKESANLMDVEFDLTKSDHFEYVHKNYYLFPQFVPDDPSLGSQHGLALINAATAWDITTGDTDVVIGIIDTGVAYNHPDLKSQIWENPLIVNGHDQDGNAFDQDIRGWDFGENDNDPIDNGGHGTIVAGIASAAVNNGVGMAGVGYQCKIMPLKVSQSNGNIPTDRVINALTYAQAHNVRIVNISLGARLPQDEENQAFKDAIGAAIQSGMVVVAAAGNTSGGESPYDIDTHNFVPASYPNVITVSASDSGGVEAATFSLFGNSVDVMAPGTNIYSTSYSPSSGAHSYKRSPGTSMAAPFVAGTVGLLLAHNPTLTTAQVYTAITQTATDKGDPGKDIYHGYGLLNAQQAVASVIGSDTKAPVLQFNENLSQFFSNEAELVVCIKDAHMIDTSSLSMTLNYAETTQNYTINNPNLTYSGLQLTMDTSFLTTLPADTPITFKISASDVYSNTGTVSKVLRKSEGFSLAGTEGLSAPILPIPNPFNPSKESTALGFEISQGVHVKINIYTLGLIHVKEVADQSLTAGYKEIDWDGRDTQGDIVPNGVYLAFVEVKNSLGNHKELVKIAVIR